MDQKQLVEAVKKLRNELGIGVMEVKNALVEANGDEAKAKQILRERGAQQALKKAEREIKAGRVMTYTHSTGRIGVMVELLCETDFVAKNEDFLAVGKDICLQIAAMNPATAEELMEQEYIKDSSVKIKDLVHGLVSKFGENIKVGKMARFEV